jgi:methyl-accepting chemotaxis protein
VEMDRQLGNFTLAEGYQQQSADMHLLRKRA